MTRSPIVLFTLALSAAPSCVEHPGEPLEREDTEVARAVHEAPVAAAPAPEAPSAADEAAPCRHGAEPSATQAQRAQVAEDVTVGSAPILGAEDAPVTIVMFTDLECPYCARAEKILTELEEQYEGEVRVAYRALPLPFHKFATLAAKAALAADEQGRYVDYQRVLLDNQHDLEREHLEQYAVDLDLDLGAFREAIDSKRIADRVRADEDEAARLGVRGTPTIFINGKRINGAQPIGVLRKTVDESLTATR